MSRWNLQRISHFLEVAKAESLSQAARKIGMSQPALTASIRKLEGELGFELFDRKRGFELTAMGRQFHPRAREALGRIDELERDMALVRRGDGGSVSIGCGPALADGRVSRALAKLLRKRPHLGMNVIVQPFPDLPKLLDEQKIDLAIGSGSIADDSEAYEAISLGEREIHYFCRSGHPLAKKKRVTPEELFSYPAVGPAMPPEIRAWLREHHPEHVAEDALSLRSNHYALLKNIVKGTDAISGAEIEVIDEEVERGELVTLKTTVRPMIADAIILKLKRRQLTPAAMELIGMLKEA
ncbi:LysR substrate-binding domain-containing protein [Haloferula sp.]|uniref:LysR family transcriptional regulator n=1 Tax=Haloferula sp. TaxID=2497595 RepID=UPI003C77249D